MHERILLATDLSARSDRALDRAAMIARRRGAELVVLHVLEPGPDNRYYPRTRTLAQLATVARAQLAYDLGDIAADVTIRIEEGDAAEIIERVAREMASTLLVVGVARAERLGRFTLGKTVEKLVRRIDVPLLIVTERPRTPYQRVAVAVDFSSTSGPALALAAELFPQRSLTVFHAYDPRAMYGASDVTTHAEQSRGMAERAFDEWLTATGLPSDTRARLVPRIELGDPAHLLRDAAERGELDLLVIGARRRAPLVELFVGSVAKRILAELPCDALLVRESQLPVLPVAPARVLT